MRSLPLVLQVALLTLAVTAGFLDYRTRRIPNLPVLFGLMLGIGLNTMLDGTTGLGAAVRGVGLALLIYFPLFALRAMGAGDAKLMAAVGSIVGPGNWVIIFFWAGWTAWSCRDDRPPPGRTHLTEHRLHFERAHPFPHALPCGIDPNWPLATRRHCRRHTEWSLRWHPAYFWL